MTQPRAARPTVKFIDEYCQEYKNLFPEVRSFEVYKPKTRLKKGESYRSKPQIAAQMLRELKNQGFKFYRVLADSLYGESASNFIKPYPKMKLGML